MPRANYLDVLRGTSKRMSTDEYTQWLMSIGEQARSRYLQQMQVPKSRGITRVVRSQEERDAARLSKEERKARIRLDAATLAGERASALEAQKQRGRIQLDLLGEQQKYDFELFKRELTYEERLRKVRLDEATASLNEAKTDKLITRGEWQKWRDSVKATEESNKRQWDAQKLEFSATQASAMEEQKQINKLELEQYKAELKPKKESEYAEYQRMLTTGAFRTTGDVATYWFSKKKKAEDVKTLTRQAAQQLGLVDFDEPWLGSEKDAWMNWLSQPLPQAAGADLDPEMTQVRQKYGSREEAERALLGALRDAERTGRPLEERIEDKQKFMGVLDRAFPDQPSAWVEIQTEPGVGIGEAVKGGLEMLIKEYVYDPNITPEREQELKAQIEEQRARRRGGQAGILSRIGVQQ